MPPSPPAPSRSPRAQAAMRWGRRLGWAGAALLALWALLWLALPPVLKGVIERQAGEVQAALRGPDHAAFLGTMFGNQPDRWDDTLQGADRLRVVVNALTRLRFCTPEGVMHLKASGAPEQAPPGTLPWFEVRHRRTAGTPIACGHWSTLGVLLRPDVMALDSGCVWGGCLSALRLDESDPGRHELVQVACEQSQAPDD